MGCVQDILAAKGNQFFTVEPEATVLRAAMVMNEHRIGGLVVVEGERIVGMFTERDVLQKVVAQQRDPAATRVADIMSTEVVCCTPQTSIDEARMAMKNRRIRRLPVIGGDGHPCGMISIGDLNAFEAAGYEHTIHMMHEYISGRV